MPQRLSLVPNSLHLHVEVSVARRSSTCAAGATDPVSLATASGHRRHLDDAGIRQLPGHALFARAVRQGDARIPDIRRLGIYFVRHPQLLVLPWSPVGDVELDEAADALLSLARRGRAGSAAIALGRLAPDCAHGATLLGIHNQYHRATPSTAP